MNHVSRAFVDTRDAGMTGEGAASNNNQAHGLIKVPPLVAWYHMDDDPSRMFRAVESAARVHQRNDESVDASLAFAAVLRRLIVAGGLVGDAALWAETSRDSPVSSDQRAMMVEG